MTVPPLPGNAPAIDGAELLDRLRSLVTTYCVLPGREHVDAVVSWIATTHCLPAFDYATRLVVRSAEKRSGKSRLLEVIDGTCHRPLRAVNATVAAIFRSLGGDHPPTLLLDEADTIFGSKKVVENNEELRGLLNAGYQRGLPVLRTVGPKHEPCEFATFAMAALAGIGSMPDTIEDRAVVVVMRRRKPSETVRPFRLRRDKPALETMREELAAWATTVYDDLLDADPDLPVEDRAADTWAPLVAVADAAGGTWPTRARAAATLLTAEAEDESTDASLNMRLLADIREVFRQSGLTFVKSAVLCEKLQAVEESPWRDFDLNPRKLGHRLRDYGIRTGHNTAKTERGYLLKDFRDAFERYLPADPSTTVRTVQQAADLQEQPDGSGAPDGSEPSGGQEPSRRNPRSAGAPDGSHGSGRTPGTGRCLTCSEPLDVAAALTGDTTCTSCEMETIARVGK